MVHIRRPRALVMGGVAAVIALAGITAVAVATGDGDGDGAQPSPTTTEAPDVTQPDATQPDVTEPSATTPPPATTAVLEDGRYAAYVTGLDVAGRTLDVDVIQLLFGEPAQAAWERDHPDDPYGLNNDYYIINENPRLRILAVSPDAPITVLDAIRPVSIGWGDLEAWFATNPYPTPDKLWQNPFWLNLRDGVIVEIEEQYIP